MTLPALLAAQPRISRWLSIGSDGTVVVRAGKVDFGQGIGTALSQVVADELDVAVHRVRVEAPTTGRSPDGGFTAGSRSIPEAAEALRQVSACARAALLSAAAVRLRDAGGELSVDELGVEDGVVRVPGFDESVTYWELADSVSLEHDATAGTQSKRPGDYRVIGTSLARVDLPAKLAGRPAFLHDVRLPGQLFGRMVRPPSRGASLRAVNQAQTAALPGVRAILIDGNVLGVVAESEAVALRAAATLRADAEWIETDALAPALGHPGSLAEADSESETLLATGEPPLGAGGAGTLQATYTRPYLAHASIGPAAAAARWTGERVEVWTHSQGIYPLRADLVRALGFADPDDVTVHHVEGAGCYGHNGADDAAYDAVLLARPVAPRPVHVVWDREDELGWAPLGPAMQVRLTATLTADGRLSSWEYDGWGGGHTSRPNTLASPSLLAYGHQAGGQPIPAAADPPLANGAGTGRNAVPAYRVPNLRVRTHRLTQPPLRTSAMRALGAHLNVFAMELFIDELARTAGTDPLEFRLAHLADPRARAVLELAAATGGWGTAVAGDSAGRGLGFARYKNSGAWCAVVAEVEAQTEVRVRRLSIAVDVGLAVNPDGVRNQIEGGAIQAVSWTVKEQVRYDGRRVTSDVWERYPILRFSEVPAVDVEIVERPDEPWLGAGEASIGPAAAAIGNAVHAAVGISVRDLPLTAANMLAAMPQ